MEYAMKPFTKMLSVLSGTEETDIQLRDTAGNLVDCNYCEVTVEHTPLEAGYIYVRANSFGYTDSTLDPSGAGTIKDEAGAGAVSIAAGHKAVIRTHATQSFNNLSIGSGFSSTVNVLINYGFKEAINPIERISVGNKGQ